MSADNPPVDIAAFAKARIAVDDIRSEYKDRVSEATGRIREHRMQVHELMRQYDITCIEMAPDVFVRRTNSALQPPTWSQIEHVLSSMDCSDKMLATLSDEHVATAISKLVRKNVQDVVAHETPPKERLVVASKAQREKARADVSSTVCVDQLPCDSLRQASRALVEVNESAASVKRTLKDAIKPHAEYMKSNKTEVVDRVSKMGEHGAMLYARRRNAMETEPSRAYNIRSVDVKRKQKRVGINDVQSIIHAAILKSLETEVRPADAPTYALFRERVIALARTIYDSRQKESQTVDKVLKFKLTVPK